MKFLYFLLLTPLISLAQTQSSSLQYLGSDLIYTYESMYSTSVNHSSNSGTPTTVSLTVSGLPAGYTLQEVEVHLGDGSSIYSGALSNASGSLNLTLKAPDGSSAILIDDVSASISDLKTTKFTLRSNSVFKTINEQRMSEPAANGSPFYGIYRPKNAWSTSAGNGTWNLTSYLASNSSYPRKIKGYRLKFSNTNMTVNIAAPQAQNCSNSKEIFNNILYTASNLDVEINQSLYPNLSNWNGARNSTCWFHFYATGTTAKVTVNSFDNNKKLQSCITSTADGLCKAYTGDVTNYTYTVITSKYGNDASPTRWNFEYALTGLTVGKKYWLLVDGDGATGNIGDISSFNVLLEMPRNTALPVELTSFNAEEYDNDIHLSWITASERNNDYFTIYRSADLTNWSAIGTVRGSGTSTTANNYTFVDNSPLKGINYYKLEQKDFDGKTEIFDPISIYTNRPGENTISFYPNPVSDDLTIQLQTSEEETISGILISDVSGRVVFTLSSLSESKQENLTIPLNQLQKGVYILTIKDQHNRILQQSKFTKE